MRVWFNIHVENKLTATVTGTQQSYTVVYVAEGKSASLSVTADTTGDISAVVEELRACVAYEDSTPEERDYAAALASFPNISWKGHCMYCGHCLPCPARISIADVTKFLNLALAQGGVPETVREHYKVLEHHAGECLQCGACESRCPFEVSIRENMRTAEKVFGY